MNLIDGHVIRVIDRRIFIPPKEWDTDKIYTIFEVEYWDEGTDSSITELWYEKGKEPDVKEGFVFQH